MFCFAYIHSETICFIELYCDDKYSKEMFRSDVAYDVLHIRSASPNLIELFGLKLNSTKETANIISKNDKKNEISVTQESIPVGCVPLAFYPRGSLSRGVSLTDPPPTGQRPSRRNTGPVSEIPPSQKEHGTRQLHRK